MNTMAGQCHRYSPYEILPIHVNGPHESTRAIALRGAVSTTENDHRDRDGHHQRAACVVLRCGIRQRDERQRQT